MNEKELKAVPIMKEIKLSRNEIIDICKELNATVVEELGKFWTGRDGQLYREQFTEVFNMGLKIRDYYDEIEQYWEKYIKKDTE